MHLPLLAVVVAAAASPSATPSAEQKALAAELVRLVQSKETYHDSLVLMTQQVSAALAAQARAQGTSLPPDFADRVMSAAMEVAPYDEVVSWAADVYARRFTAPELKDMLGFYRTPTGRKLAKLLPEIMGEVGKKVGGWMAERMPEALRRHGLGADGVRAHSSAPSDAGL